MIATPVVGDVDGDGKLELIAGTGDSLGAAVLLVWELSQSSTASNSTDWPIFKHDSARTGNLSQVQSNDAVIVGHSIPDHVMPGQEHQIQVALRNTGASTWTAADAYCLGGNNYDFYPSNRVYLSPGDSIAPGEVVTFTLAIAAPTTQGFYMMEWRMLKEGSGYFGRKVSLQIKVGNQPAFYVLHATDPASGGGVYAGGLASPISPPGYTWSENTVAFKLTPDGAGYYVLDKNGFVRWAGTAADIGSVSASKPTVDIDINPDGEAYNLINARGYLWRSSGAMDISPAPPTFEDKHVRSLAITSDYKGVYVLGKYGHVYTGGTAQPLSPATPDFGIDDIAVRIKLTADGEGYYVLDEYGRVHNGGAAPPIAPNYSFHLNEDWARDFELTADGQGYYLLDKYGNIHTGGTAEPVTLNPTPTWETGQAVDLEVADSRVLPLPYLAASQSTVFAMVKYGAPPVSKTVTVDNLGYGGALTWTASLDPLATWLGVSPDCGTTPGTVALSMTPSVPVGAYSSTVEFAATDSLGAPVESSDVGVTLYVVEELYQVHLPLVLKRN